MCGGMCIVVVTIIQVGMYISGVIAAIMVGKVDGDRDRDSGKCA